MKRIPNIIFIAAALVLCMIPSVCMIFARSDETIGNEMAVALPSITNKDGSFNVNILEDSGNYFEAHYAFRPQLITADARVQANVFKVSNTDTVVTGTDGWLYYSSTVGDFLGAKQLSERGMWNLAHNISLMQEYVERKGSKFLFTSPANKNSLYGDNMPYYYGVAESDEHNRDNLNNAMENAGVKLVRNFKDYNVMGFFEVLINLRRILKLLDDLTEIIRAEKPDLLVLIDYPDFNWRLAKRVKNFGVKILSYIPPSAWAWRKGRAKDCAAIADVFIAIFPFELPVYQSAGAEIYFLGNPLVDSVKPSMSKDESRKFFGVNESERVILLMPGSRRQEIKLLLPPMLAATKLLADKSFKFFLPVADNVENLINTEGFDIKLVKSARRYDLMSIADAAIATSGTVVLEAALLGLPSVVLYKMAPLNYFIGKLLVDIKFFSLPNILAGEKILPELLQDEVTPEKISSEVLKILDTRADYVEKLQSACKKLGEVGAATRVAKKILETANEEL